MAVVLRELAPLITAIVVAGRSGTAIATELGNMKVSSEVLALMSLGIDPPRFIVWPRLGERRQRDRAHRSTSPEWRCSARSCSGA